MTEHTEPTREAPFALTLHRRTLLRGGLLGGLGLTAAALIGCGGDDDDDDSGATTTTTTQATATASDDADDDVSQRSPRRKRT